MTKSNVTPIHSESTITETHYRCPLCGFEHGQESWAENCIRNHHGKDVTLGSPGDRIKIDDGSDSGRDGWYAKVCFVAIVKNISSESKYLFEREDGTRSFAEYRSVMDLEP